MLFSCSHFGFSAAKKVGDDIGIENCAFFICLYFIGKKNRGLDFHFFFL